MADSLIDTYFPYGTPIFYMDNVAVHIGALYVGVKSSKIMIDLDEVYQILLDSFYLGETEKDDTSWMIQVNIAPLRKVSKKMYRWNVFGRMKHIEVVKISYILGRKKIRNRSKSKQRNDSTEALPGYAIAEQGTYWVVLKVNKLRYLRSVIMRDEYVSDENDYLLVKDTNGSTIKSFNKLHQ